MRNRNFLNAFWILFLIAFIGGTGIVPLIIISVVVVVLMSLAVKQSKDTDNTTRTRNNTSRRRTVYRYGMSDTKHSQAQKTQVNAWLMQQFRRGSRSIPFNVNGHSIVLSVRADSRFTSLDSLQVECDGHSFRTMMDFRKSYGDLYDALFEQMYASSKNAQAVKPDVIVDAEVVGRPEQRQQEKAQPSGSKQAEPQKKAKPDDAESFREVINDLNDAIPDEEISNGLYKTTSLLKQLSDLEKQFPDQSSRLTKLYRNYLPYLVGILQQYTKMQHVRTDANYQSNEAELKKVIGHINDAMENNIIPSMSESSSINLSADMSTLEAMLQKDGMTSEDDISQVLKKNKSGKGAVQP